MITPTTNPASLFHDLVSCACDQVPDQTAVKDSREQLTYSDLMNSLQAVAAGLQAIGVGRNDRVAIYLPKNVPCVLSILGISRAGAIFVPINPVLKPNQVRHILEDSGTKVLITSNNRWQSLVDSMIDLESLTHIILSDIDKDPDSADRSPDIQKVVAWPQLSGESVQACGTLESDVAAILYTSGSTGQPKGVVLSHRNLVIGAKSVATYLQNTSEDRILSLLPLSFDAGLSQLTTALCVGASLVLLDYLLPRDVVRCCESEQITGITGVPPLWMQLANQKWTPSASEQLRYFANTGGKMPRKILGRLRVIFPNASPFLMYGLTEAFRSTYLDPSQVDNRPDSIGKAIPNAEILVVNEQGELCGPGEPGELVHRGPLVSLGYWNDLARTQERFKPPPNQLDGVPLPEMAVWSGDTVSMDDDGYLYFIGRRDDMIKTSGYRVSPTEIEEVAFASRMVREAAALGVEHPTLGQAILLIVSATENDRDTSELLTYFRQNLPNHMIPLQVEWVDQLPKNPNGKIDRKHLALQFADIFLEDGQ